eukprot:9037548-Pyramimonas_sp.AAC.1
MLELAQLGHLRHGQLEVLQRQSTQPILRYQSGEVKFEAYYSEPLEFKLTVIQALQRAAQVRTVPTNLESSPFAADARAS